MECVLHWFTGWSDFQKADFMKDLLDKLLPDNMESIFNSMGAMKVEDKAPSIFKCQLKLFADWFAQWTDPQRNAFLIKLRVLDSQFVIKFEEEAQRLSSN